LKQDNAVPDNANDAVWYLYMIRLENGHLYTGITTDIQRRFTEHLTGRGAKFLRGRKGLELVFSSAVGNRSSALKIEAAVKKLPKPRKESLIHGSFSIDQLSAD